MPCTVRNLTEDGTCMSPEPQHLSYSFRCLLLFSFLFLCFLPFLRFFLYFTVFYLFSLSVSRPVTFQSLYLYFLSLLLFSHLSPNLFFFTSPFNTANSYSGSVRLDIAWRKVLWNRLPQQHPQCFLFNIPVILFGGKHYLPWKAITKMPEKYFSVLAFKIFYFIFPSHMKLIRWTCGICCLRWEGMKNWKHFWYLPA